MAYALIGWDPPAGEDPDDVAKDLIETITFDGGTRKPVPFLERIVLYPSRPGGIGFSQVRAKLHEVVQRHPGLVVMIIMPDEGSRVAGWFPADTFDEARPIMNQPGSSTFPSILQP